MSQDIYSTYRDWEQLNCGDFVLKVFPRIASVEKQRIYCVSTDRGGYVMIEWSIDMTNTSRNSSTFWFHMAALIFNNPPDKICFKRVSSEFWKQLHLRDPEVLCAEKFWKGQCSNYLWNMKLSGFAPAFVWLEVKPWVRSTRVAVKQRVNLIARIICGRYNYLQ